jgi:hypothetical protein
MLKHPLPNTAVQTPEGKQELRCVKTQRIPANNSVGVRKHWARNLAMLLPLSGYGIARAEHAGLLADGRSALRG